MRIIIQPTLDKYCDKLLDVTVSMMKAVKKKHPEVPPMEITLESQSSDSLCAHLFKIADISHGMVMIRCERCQRIYHMPFTRENVVEMKSGCM